VVSDLFTCPLLSLNIISMTPNEHLYRIVPIFSFYKHKGKEIENKNSTVSIKSFNRTKGV
jgi:hypothetical protein